MAAADNRTPIAVSLVAFGLVAGSIALVTNAALSTSPSAPTADAGVSPPTYFGAATQDADLRDRFHFCHAWAGGSAPVGTIYYGASVYLEPGSLADRLVGTPPSDAGVEIKYGVLVVGIPPTDGGSLGPFIRAKLEADGVRLMDDSTIKRIGTTAPVQKPWMAAGGCSVYFWGTEAADLPKSPAVECACGAGCYWHRGDGGKAGWVTGIGSLTFNPGQWKLPDGGGTCIPKTCVELEGYNSLPAECQ